MLLWPLSPLQIALLQLVGTWISSTWISKRNAFFLLPDMMCQYPLAPKDFDISSGRENDQSINNSGGATTNPKSILIW